MGLLDILFPPLCLACGRVCEEEGVFCEGCGGDAETLPEPRCARCAEPGPLPLCPRCCSRPPAFSQAFAPFSHEGAVARAIHLFKYEDRPELARPLAALAWRAATDFLEQAPSWVCALPLHLQRYRERRYDQAELLARELARLTKRTHRPRLLHRHRETRRQVGLSESEREANVAGAFQATAEVRGRSLLLVDDVFTTGATARAASQALLEAGATEVQVFTLARAFS